MSLYLVSSTFAKPRKMAAPTHAAALEQYLDQHEAETGWSYPSDAAISVGSSGQCRDYVCDEDGTFRRYHS